METPPDESPLDLELEQLTVHGQCEPAEVQLGEPIFAQVENTGMGRTEDWRVRRISPFGVELSSDSHDLLLEETVEIDLHLQMGDQTSDCKGTVEWIKEEKEGRKVAGVRRARPESVP